MLHYQEKGKIIVLNLACRLVDDAHIADNIKIWFSEILNQFEIEEKQILVLSIDSAANIQKAAREFLSELKVELFMIEVSNSFDDGESDEDFECDTDNPTTITDFEIESANDSLFLDTEPVSEIESPLPQVVIPSSYKIPCVAHQLQLAVNKFAEEPSIKKMLTSARVLSSKLRNQNISRMLRNENYPMALIDQVTRWMSTFNMTNRLERLEPFCQANGDLFKGKYKSVRKKTEILILFLC